MHAGLARRGETSGAATVQDTVNMAYTSRRPLGLLDRKRVDVARDQMISGTSAGLVLVVLP